MRLTTYWKPLAAALVAAAATIYAGLVAREFILRTRLGAERRGPAQSERAIFEDQAMLGSVWAHRHRPLVASECPDYSASFKAGCAAVVAARAAESQ